jgi:hypothetical protein
MRPSVLTRVAAPAIVAITLLSGCSGGHAAVVTPPPHPLTAAEANELANIRFLDLTAGGAQLSIAMTNGANPLRLQGWIDWKSQLGYASFSGTGSKAAATSGIAQWNAQGLGLLDGTFGGLPPVPVPNPNSGWTFRSYEPGVTIDLLCQLLLQLSADRPENATLLQQSDASWLSQQQLDGNPVDVIEGPGSPGQATFAPGKGPIRYWIDTTSGKLLRIQALLGEATQFSVIDFSYPVLPAIPLLPQLQPSPAAPSS